MPSFAKIAKSLYQLLCKDEQWVWTFTCQKAYEFLVATLTATTIQELPKQLEAFARLFENFYYYYRLSPMEEQEAEKWIKEMKAASHIRDIKSPIAAPLMFVPKPYGSLRPCIVTYYESIQFTLAALLKSKLGKNSSIGFASGKRKVSLSNLIEKAFEEFTRLSGYQRFNVEGKFTG